MVSIKKARLYCKEDFSLIENYDKAKSDLLEVWDLHHRKEDEGYSYKELKNAGLYYKRPASELIFLTHAEHSRLHQKGKKHFLGKHHSEETKRKIAESKSKSVLQIDKQTGDIIKTWPCAMEVEIVLGICHGSISKCCSDKLKSAGGFVWRYID